MEPKPFSYSYYRHMLTTAMDKGFVVSSFENYAPTNAKTVIMRHDVDYTLNGVRQVAQIERDLGVTSTFCFRVHAHEYNLFAPHVQELVGEIREMGHEIGLHFEAMAVGRALNRSPRDLMQLEKLIIEQAAGVPVKTASEHRDISHVVHETDYFHDKFSVLEFGFENFSMEDRFFREMKYLSDSNAVWREGDLLEHLDDHSRLQVLVHPDWWFEDDLLLKGPYFHGLGT